MSEWLKYEGPRGGRGWRNRATGEIRYQENMPEEQATPKQIEAFQHQGRDGFYENEVFQSKDGPVVLWIGDREIRAVVGNSVVGAIVVNKPKEGESEGTVFNVAVKSAYQRLGIATAMYEAAERHFFPLKPSGAQFPDAFHFWLKYRPTAIHEHDLRRFDKKLIGREMLKPPYGKTQIESVSEGGSIVRILEGEKKGKTTWVSRDEVIWQLPDVFDKQPLNPVFAWAKEQFKDETVATNFQKWFGDSKVVNEDGTPKAIYRGMRRKPSHDKFVLTQGRATASFVDNPEIASVYAKQLTLSPEHGAGSNVGKYYASIKKPFDMRDLGEQVYLSDVVGLLRYDFSKSSGLHDAQENRFLGYADIVELLNNMDGLAYKTNAQYEIEAESTDGYQISTFEEVAQEIERLGDDGDFESLDNLLAAVKLDAYMIADSSDWVDALQSLGYDGIAHKDVFDVGAKYYEGDVALLEEGDDGPIHDTWRPFDQAQIKSAIANSGRFSVESRSTLMSTWVKYKGPRGGKGWRNTETGDIRYQAKMPEDDQSEGVVRVSSKQSEPKTSEAVSASKAVENIVSQPGWFRIRQNMFGVETEKGTAAVEIYAFNDSVHLAFIGVSEDNRGKGIASDVMRQIVSVADQHSAAMDLEVDPQDETGLTAEQLTSWYERFGFESQPYGDGTPGSPMMKRAPMATRDSSDTNAEQQAKPNPQSKTYQWALNRFGTSEHAKNFVQWFGDSKVVNADGSPKIVYHGTGGVEFDEFKTLQGSDFGSHFGTPEQAEDFTQRDDGAHVIPVLLSMKNPISLPDLGRWDFKTLSKELSNHGIEVEDSPYQIETADMGENYRRRFQRQFENIARALEKAGYDGIVYQNIYEGDERSYSYIVFRPQQIKSAIANSGAFSKSSKKIAMSTWVPYVGPRDGRGWRNVKTGDVRYQQHPPSEDTQQPITAFHGTPYEFDSFDEEKILSGAGINQYGWGLYFSDSREVADHYAKNYFDQAKVDLANKRMREIAAKLDEIGDGRFGEYKTDEGKRLKAEYDQLMSSKLDRTGKVVHVRFRPQPNEYLRWEDDLRSQPSHIQAILKSIKPADLGLLAAGTNSYGTLYTLPNGNQWNRAEVDPQTASIFDINQFTSARLFYENVAAALGGYKQASLWLRSKGIRGVAYKQASATNYVVFEDDDIEVLESPTINVDDYGNLADAAYDVKTYADFMEVVKTFAPRSKEVKFENGEVVWSDHKNVYWFDKDSSEMSVVDGQEWIDEKSEDELHSYYPNYQQQFYDDFWSPGGGKIYHATPEKNIESIIASGLNASDVSRGFTNRGIGSAVFATTEWDSAMTGTYGDTVIEIDTGKMAEAYRREGKELPFVSEEPHYTERNLREALAHAIGLESYNSSDSFDGVAPDTVIIYGNIPPEFVKVAHRPPVQMCADYYATRLSTVAQRQASHDSWLNHRDHWVAYTGPRDGHGWKNILTDEIRYQKARPGDDGQKVLPFVDWDLADAENVKQLRHQWESVREDIDELVVNNLDQSHNLPAPQLIDIDLSYAAEMAHQYVNDNWSKIAEAVRSEIEEQFKSAWINSIIGDFERDNKTEGMKTFMLPPLSDHQQMVKDVLAKRGLLNESAISTINDASGSTDLQLRFADIVEGANLPPADLNAASQELFAQYERWNKNVWPAILSERIEGSMESYEYMLNENITERIYENVIAYASQNGFDFADSVSWQDTLKWPKSFDLTPDDPWSVDSQRQRNIGHFIQASRMVYWAEQYGVQLTFGDAAQTLVDIWKSWKGSSSNDTSVLFQIAAMEELGLHSRAEIHPANYYYWMQKMKAKAWARERYWIYRAAARACWESNQYVMEQAKTDKIRLYRGIKIDDSGESWAGKVVHNGLEVVYKKADSSETVKYTKVRSDVPIKKATLNSFSDNAVIANNWGISNVKLRAEVPREAIISCPAFGVNYHQETEYVVMGTAWSWWDAWIDRSPESWKVPGELPERSRVTIDTVANKVTVEPLEASENENVQQSVAG